MHVKAVIEGKELMRVQHNCFMQLLYDEVIKDFDCSDDLRNPIEIVASRDDAYLLKAVRRILKRMEPYASNP